MSRDMKTLTVLLQETHDCSLALDFPIYVVHFRITDGFFEQGVVSCEVDKVSNPEEAIEKAREKLFLVDGEFVEVLTVYGPFIRACSIVEF